MVGEERDRGETDLRLVEDFQKGREEAFDLLVKRYMVRTVQLARVVVGNYEDARDISQEAFLKAYRALKSFRRGSAFSTWLYRILINTAKDFLRRRQRRKFFQWVGGPESDSLLEQTVDPTPRAGEELVQKELRIQIDRAVKKLPFKQRWALTLRFIEGLSISEVSQVMGSAEGTVKANLHFAMRKFKKEIFPYWEGWEVPYGSGR